MQFLATVVLPAIAPHVVVDFLLAGLVHTLFKECL